MKKIIYSLCMMWFATCMLSAKKEELFYFQFDNEELIDIVHRFAAKKEVNIVFPVKPITARITMYMNEPLTLDQAWEKLYTILDLAGYSLINKNSEYTIVKTEPGKDGTIRDALPIFIGVSPEKIPDSDERIRYLYYLTNLKITEKFNDTDLSKVLSNLLAEGSYITDAQTNGIIITEKANVIKSLMDIITKLDSATFTESFEVIKLHNTNPTLIAKLFEDILKTNNQQYKFETKTQLSESSYFPKNVRAFPMPRTNSLLVLGTQAAIDRIKDFIAKYIDVELESGKSILHIYKLQYMNANDIAGVLTKVLGLDKGGSGQSSGDGKTPVNPATLERSFDQIIIRTDGAKPDSGKDAYYGNNNLIVAARNDDWIRVKSLIEQLDRPQPQVIIEVLIANLTLQELRSLGSISCNPAELNFPHGVNIQSAQIGGGVVTPESITAASSLATDLMAPSVANPPPPPSATPASVVSSLTPGATAIAINNGTAGANGSAGSAWAVLQMLDLFSYTKVIANPHLIATNNQKASVAIGQTRLINDQTTGSGGGTTVVTLKDIPAIYTVTITPRIFTSETPGGKDDAVNLKVRVDIVDFLPGTTTSNARNNRTVDTTALLKNGQILALGGLINHEMDDALNESPILGKIPILGYLAKSRSTTRINTNLTIFIAPTIIEPRLRGGASKYTTDYVELSKKYSKEAELFDSLQDPVTRWFFKRGYDPETEIKEFMDQDEFKRQANKQEYKSIIDVEQAASVKEADASKSEKNGKKSKRVVLSNLDVADKQKEKAPAFTPEKVPAPTAEPRQIICAAAPQATKELSQTIDPVATHANPSSENSVVITADMKEQHRAMLKEKFQKLLESEDNPFV